MWRKTFARFRLITETLAADTMSHAFAGYSELETPSPAVSN